MTILRTKGNPKAGVWHKIVNMHMENQEKPQTGSEG
jgi:hypothetical protein